MPRDDDARSPGDAGGTAPPAAGAPAPPPSRAELEALIQTSSEGMILMDSVGRIRWASRAAAEIYGVDDPSVFVGREAAAFLAPGDRSAGRETLDLVVGDGEPTDIEFPVQRPDGTEIVVHARVALTRDDAGRPTGFAAVVRDYSARMRAEAALRESREILQQVLDTIPVRVFWKDRESRFLGCNRRFAGDAGLDSPKAIVGKTDYDFNFREHAAAYRADDREVMESGVPKLGYEEAQTAPDGRRLWLRTSKIPLRDANGEVYGVLGTYEDTTAVREATEELARRNEALEVANRELERLHQVKDEFVAMVSHELRTPLVTGIGYLELLLEGRFGALPEAARDRLRIGLRNLLRLSSLIQNLLSYQSVISPSSRSALGLEPVALGQVVEDCVSEFGVRHRHAAERLQVEVAPDLPRVRAEEELLRVVIANLLDNAVHHAGPEAKIRLAAAEVAGGVEVTVSDSGAGIPPELQGRVFEPFVKSRESYRGSGLGLAIVKGILQAHGSDVALVSETGTGTRLTFTLPLAAPISEAAQARPRSLTPVVGIAALARIAIIEDDEDSREYLRIALERRGFVVVEAASAEEALARVDFGAVDLCLVDMSLPGQDGAALVRTLRARPELGDLPILMLSARAEDAARQAAEAAGCDGYLVKPVALESLMQAIRKRLIPRGL